MSEFAYLRNDGTIQMRQSKNCKAILGVVQEVKPNGDVLISLPYAKHKGTPQMEACELEVE